MKSGIRNTDDGTVEVADQFALRERALELSLQSSDVGTSTDKLVGRAALFENYLKTGYASVDTEIDLKNIVRMNVKDIIDGLLPSMPQFQELEKEVKQVIERYPAVFQSQEMKTKVAVMILDGLGSPVTNWNK